MEISIKSSRRLSMSFGSLQQLKGELIMMITKHPLVRRLILLGTPLLLGILQFNHPASVSYDNLLPIIDWWLLLHLMQLPLFGLLALTIYILIYDIDNIFATISRIGLGIFVVFYTALDSVLGVASGLLIKFGSTQSMEQQGLIEDAYLALFYEGNNLLGDIAVYSWFVAGISAAIALYLNGKNHLGVLLLFIGTLFYHSHAYPFGPLAMLAIFISMILFEFFPQNQLGENENKNT
jgi:hypothetical protein